jgi:hypothetical protein
LIADLRVGGFLVLAAALGAAAAGSAEGAEQDPHNRRGLTFGLRLGLAAPVGNALVTKPPPPGATTFGTAGPPTGVLEANTSALLLPLWVDLAYRITKHWRAGGYFQIADAFSGSQCTSCGGYDVRFGIDGEYHFTPGRKTDGWMGLGTGYEILHVDLSQSNLVTAYRGFEFASGAMGLDIHGGQGGFRWGPYTAVTLAEYNHVRQISSTSDISFTPSEAVHLWFFIGLRGSYDL